MGFRPCAIDNGPAADALRGEGEGALHVLAFDSTHAAMAAQKLLAELNPYVIPTPREITADCGMSLRFACPDDAAKAAEILKERPDIEALCHWHVV